MSSGTDDTTEIDAPADHSCYRCERPLVDERWIRLSTQPRPGLAGAYDAVSRPCCPDCVAALGLLEFVSECPRSEPIGSD